MTPDSKPWRPARPSLYRLASDGASLDLLYAPCPDCAGLTFPANAPGCMHCGASLQGVEPVAKPGTATLLEFVTLHVSLVPGMAVPSIVGDLRLEDGIIEEGVIAGVADESALRHGMSLRATPQFIEASQTFECVFTPTAPEASP